MKFGGQWMVVALVAFGLGVGIRLWVGGARGVERGGASGGQGVSRTGGSAVGGGGPAPGQAAGVGPSEAGGAGESVESVLGAEGFERAERLARFLADASAEALERLLDGLRDAGGMEMVEGDAIFLRWMAIDPEGGLAYAEKGRYGTSMAWWAWGKTDPEAAFAAALEKRDAWTGSQVIRAIGQSDPERAQALLAQYPRFAEDGALVGVSAGLMKVDPAAGATLLAGSSTDLGHEQLINGWARREPDAALAWAKELPDMRRRSEALALLIKEWAGTHPERIKPAIEALPESRTKWRLYAQHASHLAATDVEAAQAWVDAAPEASLRREAAGEMARGLAADDPAAALAILRGLDWSAGNDWRRADVVMPDGTRSSVREIADTVSSALAEVARVAPRESMEMLADLPENAANRQSLAHSAFGSWVRSDSMAASEWLAAQPPGTLRSVATQSLVSNLIQGPEPDFEAAAQWALDLHRQPQGNQDSLKNVFLNWLRTDPASAQAALDSPEWPADVRADLARQFQSQQLRSQ